MPAPAARFGSLILRLGHAGPRHFHQHRGVAYWQNESGSERRIIFGTYDGRLIALDARTGKPCSDFGNHGVINLRDGVEERPSRQLYAVTSPPAIYRDLVITGAEVPEYPSVGPSGMVRAFDVHTGKLAWTFHTIPQPGEPGHETWQGEDWKNRTGANVWSVMSVDTERGMVFLPIGSPSYDFYGGDRKGQNLFGNSFVALDAATGKLIWYYQMVHHDIWDYDLPAQPVLITVQRDGEADSRCRASYKNGLRVYSRSPDRQAAIPRRGTAQYTKYRAGRIQPGPLSRFR